MNHTDKRRTITDIIILVSNKHLLVLVQHTTQDKLCGKTQFSILIGLIYIILVFDLSYLGSWSCDFLDCLLLKDIPFVMTRSKLSSQSLPPKKFGWANGALFAWIWIPLFFGYGIFNILPFVPKKLGMSVILLDLFRLDWCQAHNPHFKLTLTLEQQFFHLFQNLLLCMVVGFSIDNHHLCSFALYLQPIGKLTDSSFSRDSVSSSLLTNQKTLWELRDLKLVRGVSEINTSLPERDLNRVID